MFGQHADAQVTCSGDGCTLQLGAITIAAAGAHNL
jgi:hypothetical protein